MRIHGCEALSTTNAMTTAKTNAVAAVVAAAATPAAAAAAAADATDRIKLWTCLYTRSMQ